MNNTKTQHQPAPWTADKWGHAKDANGQDVIFSGLTMTCGNHPHQKTAEANTRLAIAAPKLLAALKTCYTPNSWLGDRPYYFDLEAVRAAIAEAEGTP